MHWFRAKTMRTLTMSVLGVCSSVTMLLSASQAQTSVPKQVAGTNISICKDQYLFGNLDIFNGLNNVAQRRFDRNLETVVQIKQALLQRQVQLAIVYVPFVGRIYPGRLPSDFKAPKLFLAAFAHSLKQWQRNGAFIPDLNAAFMQARGPAGDEFPLYLRQDNHWSMVGALEAARVVVAAVNTKFKIALTGLPEKTSSYESLAPVVHEGNYYRSLPVTERAKVVQEQFKPLRFTQNTGNDMLAAETPGVVLVGSSFSKLREFGFADALAHFLRRDVLNVSESGKSFWTPLLDYLPAMPSWTACRNS